MCRCFPDILASIPDFRDSHGTVPFTLGKMRNAPRPGALASCEARPSFRESMRRFRRVTALFLGLFLAQLTLAGSAYACVAHAQHGAERHAAMAMPAVLGQGAAAPLPAAGGVAIGDYHSCGAPGSSMPCALPGSGASCGGAGACATALLDCAAVTASDALSTPAALRVDRALTPPSRTLAPELPPPRS